MPLPIPMPDKIIMPLGFITDSNGDQSARIRLGRIADADHIPPGTPVIYLGHAYTDAGRADCVMYGAVAEIGRITAVVNFYRRETPGHWPPGQNPLIFGNPVYLADPNYTTQPATHRLATPDEVDRLMALAADYRAETGEPTIAIGIKPMPPP